MNRIWSGCKLAIAFVLGLPFIVFLLPMWYVYVWSGSREGRPDPVLPWRSMTRREPQSRVVEEPARTETLREIPLAVAPSAGGVALVAGGGKRLGGAVSRDLAALGYRVGVLFHQDRAAAEDCVAAIRQAGGEAEALGVDLTDPGRMESCLDEAERRLGGVPEVVVNCAGLLLPTDPAQPDWEEMNAVLRVNLQGPMWFAMRVARRMRVADRQGLIVQVCDIWGERPLVGHAAYSAAKAGLLMATQALAREVGPGVRVNAIAPGAILPPEGDSGPLAEGFRKMLDRTPLAAHAGPEAVVHAVRYLLGARFVTGEVLHVDGGRRLL